uniref:Uncharacterized protein n=1 Tax=Spongospora subterranea TaxID=70186 RepID=A0A0H5QMZ7_9EUKA|eukprot:CRZ03560.1 hypothetical protein [Spongospora subterranea]
MVDAHSIDRVQESPMAGVFDALSGLAELVGSKQKATDDAVEKTRDLNTTYQRLLDENILMTTSKDKDMEILTANMELINQTAKIISDTVTQHRLLQDAERERKQLQTDIDSLQRDITRIEEDHIAQSFEFAEEVTNMKAIESFQQNRIKEMTAES